MKRICLFITLFILLFILAGCSFHIEGTYSGSGVTMTLYDGIVQSNILGFPMNGTYEANSDSIILTFNMFGISQTIRGKLINDTIVFADATLTKTNH